MRGLKDKVAIVTGAAAPMGIGFAAATRLAEEGALVVLTDINADGVAARAGELRTAGHRAIALAHDATSEESWDDVLRATKAEFGRLDILVNNAAIARLSYVVDTELADWRRIVDVNGSMTFLGCRMAAREMKASGRGGAIVNVASVASIVAAETAGPYCASKAAVEMLTKVLALEVAKDGIRVNSIHPGYTRTETSLASMPDPDSQLPQLLSIVPLGRLADPGDMAAGIAFLASEDAAFCTGTALVVDGGLTAR